MKSSLAVAAALALALAGLAQAQSTGVASAGPQLSAKPDPFNGSFQPYPRAYGGNEAVNANSKSFDGAFRTDPRLLGGFELSPTLALEMGYVDLYDRGFHRVDGNRPEETSGALFTRGFATHVAAKYTVPVTDKLQAYGKLGVAHGGRNEGGAKESATGLYTGVGARYQVSDKAVIDANVGRHGNATKKWGNGTNADGVRAGLKMGF